MIQKFTKYLMGAAVFALLATAGAVSAQVATVFEMTGSATAAVTPPTPAAGAPAAPAPVGRALRKGDAVNQGETISTGAMSSIVLRFSDGQVVALSATSSMAINDYVFNQAEPAKSNVLLSLLNGGMRAVTGLIGKARPQAVAYRAGNATIGIRGTDTTISNVAGNVAVTVANGLVTFTVGNQTVSVPAGQGVFQPRGQTTIVVQSAAQITAQVATAATAAAAAAAAPGATQEQKDIAAALTAVSAALTIQNTQALQNAITAAVRTAPAAALTGTQPTGVTPGTGTTGTPTTGTGSGSGGAGGGGVPCTSVSPIRVPAGCTG